jgi:HPt (histidine-containing phosphotransfer) domain-containing protein
MAPRVPYLSFWPRAVLLCASADLCSRYSVRGNKVNVATPEVLNMTELLNRVDNDHELVSELFFIFKSVFPSHLQRLSDAVAKQLSKQVEAESHTLKGMLLNLSAARAAALAADLENRGREGKIAGMREAFTGFQCEAQTLLLQMESVEFQP